MKSNPARAKAARKPKSPPAPTKAAPPRRATITDVAREAGVNIATVSRVLSRPELVKHSTFQRVKRVIEQLRYTPNLSARALAKSRTGAVAVITQSIEGAYISDILAGIERELEKNDRHMLVVVAQDIESLLQKVSRVVADAMIVSGWHLGSAEVDVIAERQIKTVLYQCIVHSRAPGGTLQFSEIHLDHRRACELLVDEMVAAGASRLAYLDTGPDLDSASYMGFLKGLARHKLLHNPRLALPIGDGTPRGDEVYRRGWDAAARLLDEVGDPFEGIIAGGDINALGFSNALRKRGLRVPEDIRVAAINDSVLNRYASPSITAAFFDPKTIASTILSCLDSGTTEKVVIEPGVVSRESTAPPSSV